MCTFNLAKKHEMKLFTTCWVTTISLSLNLLQSWPKMKHWGIHNKQVPWDILTKVEFDLMPLLSPLSPASIPPWLSAVGRPLKRQASCSTAMNGMLRLYQWKINFMYIQKKTWWHCGSLSLQSIPKNHVLENKALGLTCLIVVGEVCNYSLRHTMAFNAPSLCPKVISLARGSEMMVSFEMTAMIKITALFERNLTLPRLELDGFFELGLKSETDFSSIMIPLDVNPNHTNPWFGRVILGSTVVEYIRDKKS